MSPLLLFLLIACVFSEDLTVERDNLSLEIEVKYPEKDIKGDEMYLRGNGLGLSRVSGRKMDKTGSDTWTTTLTYKMTIDNWYQCSGAKCPEKTNKIRAEEGLNMEVYLNDKVSSLGIPCHTLLPMSMSSSFFKSPPKVSCYPWFKKKQAFYRTKSYDVPRLQGRGKRNITTILPPSFGENLYKTYETLIVIDINEEIIPNVFNFTEGFFVHQPILPEIIIIGFGDYNDGTDTGNDRDSVLTQVPGDVWDCKNGTFADLCSNCLDLNILKNISKYYEVMKTKCGKVRSSKGLADMTLDFLINQVLPYEKTETGGRALVNQENLGILGYSLGGLFSCYAAWTRFQVFGKAGCMASSFWWPLDATTNTNQFQFYKIMNNSYLQADRLPQKIYIDAGGAEHESVFNMGGSAKDVAMIMASTPFFKMNENLWYNMFPGEKHGMVEFGRRLWVPMTTLYKAHYLDKLEETKSKHPQNGSVVSQVNSFNFIFFVVLSMCLKF